MGIDPDIPWCDERPLPKKGAPRRGSGQLMKSGRLNRHAPPCLGEALRRGATVYLSVRRTTSGLLSITRKNWRKTTVPLFRKEALVPVEPFNNVHHSDVN